MTDVIHRQPDPTKFNHEGISQDRIDRINKHLQDAENKTIKDQIYAEKYSNRVGIPSAIATATGMIGTGGGALFLLAVATAPATAPAVATAAGLGAVALGMGFRGSFLINYMAGDFLEKGLMKEVQQAQDAAQTDQAIYKHPTFSAAHEQYVRIMPARNVDGERGSLATAIYNADNITELFQAAVKESSLPNKAQILAVDKKLSAAALRPYRAQNEKLDDWVEKYTDFRVRLDTPMKPGAPLPPTVDYHGINANLWYLHNFRAQFVDELHRKALSTVKSKHGVTDDEIYGLCNTISCPKGLSLKDKFEHYITNQTVQKNKAFMPYTDSDWADPMKLRNRGNNAHMDTMPLDAYIKTNMTDEIRNLDGLARSVGTPRRAAALAAGG